MTPRFVRFLPLAAAMFGCTQENVAPLGETPPPPRLTVVAGDSQAALAGQRLDSAVVVRLADSLGHPLAGQPVHFAITRGGGSLSAAVDTTDSEGKAGVEWTLGPIPGRDSLRAAVDTVTLGIEALGFSPVTPESLAVGLSFSCHLRAGGEAWCWGLDFGSPTPARLGGGQHFTTIAAANDFACGLTAEHDAYCWFGRFSPAPTMAVPAAPDLKLHSIAVGEDFACGLTADALAYCWGLGWRGQLGNGGNVESATPVAVSGGLRFRSLSAGWAWACGVTLSGRAYCWGDNARGQLGVGDTIASSIPRRVATNQQFVSVTNGNYHACGITVDGEAWCWGDNSAGQLDGGNGPSALVPRRTNFVWSSNWFISLRAGWNSTCGIAADGLGYCWGANDEGQLGHPTSVQNPGITGGHRYSRLAISAHHACGLTTGGEAYCWGSMLWEAIGIGKTSERVRPSAVIGGGRFRDVAVGRAEACALNIDETTWCWGYPNPVPSTLSGAIPFSNLFQNTDLLCALATGSDVFCWNTGGTPFRAQSGWPFSSITVASQSCGLTPDGIARCWGTNASGELGDSTTTERIDPTVVAGGLTFTELAAGSRHTCGIATGGAAWCWGADSLLGSGVIGGRAYPVPVSGDLTFAHLAAGAGSTLTCGITIAGAAYCWGQGAAGQLGDGTTQTVSLVPTPVSGGHQFTALSVGIDFTCGLSTGGQALCWGANGRGQLGNGGQTASPFPVSVADGHSFSTIAAGTETACGIDGGGAAWCWGANDYGQLGFGATATNVAIPTRVTEP